MKAWVERELQACEFPDKRLKVRLGKLLGELGDRVGGAIPFACQDWAAVKAAYRFFSNPRVNESLILKGHFSATAQRVAATKGLILLLHDTTEFSLKRENNDTFGKTHRLPGGLGHGHKPYTACGVLMHSSLAITPVGEPLGLLAIKFWTRKTFKGTNALRGVVNLTRIPIEQKESVRWLENMRQANTRIDPTQCVHVGDRECDIFEFFCAAKEEKTHFLVRTCNDRLACSGKTTVARRMKREPIGGERIIEILGPERKLIQIHVAVRYCRLMIHPPIGKERHYSPQALTVIHVNEQGKPSGREPLQWKLLTDLPVKNLSQAMEKVEWYTQRWKIETFHKILKSGCKAEESKLRTAPRLANFFAVLCILGWRVFWLTMVNRTNPNAAAASVFTTTEISILEHLNGTPTPKGMPKVGGCLNAIAQLGGYLNRTSDPPPGNNVLWRGISRLTDIHLGWEIHQRLVGN